MRPELWAEGWDEREREPERDWWLTSVVGSKSVDKKGETQAQTQDSYLSTKAMSKGFLSTPAVFKYNVLEEVADQFVSHLLLPSL